MARWIYFNPNPRGRRVIDCTVRAICAVTGKTWDQVYSEAALEGYIRKNMPSGDGVWRSYLLRRLGYGLAVIPDSCPDCYTVGDFADDHPRGRYVLGTGSHAVAVIDGDVWDTWNSLSEPVLYYFYYKGEKI